MNQPCVLIERAPARWSTALAAATALALALVLVGPAGATTATTYRQTNLVSDIPGWPG